MLEERPVLPAWPLAAPSVPYSVGFPFLVMFFLCLRKLFIVDYTIVITASSSFLPKQYFMFAVFMFIDILIGWVPEQRISFFRFRKAASNPPSPLLDSSALQTHIGATSK